MQCLVSFLILQSSWWERESWLLCSVVLICVTVSVLWFFLMVPWVGLQCAIVVFPHHTHLLFFKISLVPYDKYYLTCVLLYYWIYLNCCEKVIKCLIKLCILSPFLNLFINLNNTWALLLDPLLVPYRSKTCSGDYRFARFCPSVMLSCPGHISNIIWGIYPIFGLWMHLVMAECRIPFWVTLILTSDLILFHFGVTLTLTSDLILSIFVSGAYLLHYLR